MNGEGNVVIVVGAYIYPNGEKYVGGWKDGKMHGNGKIIYNMKVFIHIQVVMYIKVNGKMVKEMEKVFAIIIYRNSQI